MSDERKEGPQPAKSELGDATGKLGEEQMSQMEGIVGRTGFGTAVRWLNLGQFHRASGEDSE